MLNQQSAVEPGSEQALGIRAYGGAFIRCSNPQEVPESFCVRCHHTLVAPSLASLELVERKHNCTTQYNENY